MPTIESVETLLVSPRWLFVRIRTSDGLTGWGEGTLEGHCDAVAAVISQYAEYLVGQDARRIEDHWQVLTKGGFYRGGPVFGSAVSGIDQALWDLAGKRLGVPVHELLGGAVRDKIRVYGWVGGDEPSEVADHIAQQLEVGLTAVKMNASGKLGKLASSQELDEVVKRVAAAREVLGPERDVAVDFHGRSSYATSRKLLPLLEPFQPLFVEEPITPENSHMLQHLVGHSPIPIATGERLYLRQDFLPILQAGVAIVQPDISHSGGISETRRIATLAETFDVLIAPHCPLGPLALAASLQLGFASPNHLIQEQSIGIHYNQGSDVLDYVVNTEPLAFGDGSISLLTGPGLGIEIDEQAVERAAKVGHSWRTPLWRHGDGSFAEW